MELKFANKTLLVLGSNVMATEIVEYARHNGAYVIVADYYPVEKSAAKRVADEAINISTLDIDALYEFCKTRKIDGIFSGVSENNLLSAMTLSQRLGLRFYCTREQWDRIERKDLFRELCHQYCVPCPSEYYTGSAADMPTSMLDEVRYPLVVKPVDCASSLGVAICNNRMEVEAAIEYADKVSESGSVILEEFVSGDEFTAHYTICDGKAAFSFIDNRYPVAVNCGQVTTIPAARIYPSTFIDEYLKKVNQPMLALCEGMGLKDAIIFIQGMYNMKNGQFSVFEAGLRSAAECPCRLSEKLTGQNHVLMLVDAILLGESNYDLKSEDPRFGGKVTGIISYVAKGGVVGTIDGLEEAVKHTPSVRFYESRYPVGSETPNGNTLRQLMIRFGMICDNRSQMAEDVRYLNDHITVLDDAGQDMVIKMDPERITSDFFIQA